MERKTKRKRKFKNYEGLLYILPWIIGFLWFRLYPFFTSLYYSFTDFIMLNEPKFIGFENYIRLFTADPYFWNSLKVTLQYTMVVPGKLILALAVALILNMRMKGIGFYRTFYYLPSILGGSIAVSVLWKIMFMNEGVVNRLLVIPLGFDAVNWLGDPDFALGTVASLAIWQFGSSMVLFLAALKQIPASLHEAALIDGASRLRVFFNITLPMITPIIFFNMIMQTINALQEFTTPFVLTNGGPMHRTFLLGIKLYQDAFSFQRMGYASAVSWVLFIIIALIGMVLFRSSSMWVHYDDKGEF